MSGWCWQLHTKHVRCAAVVCDEGWLRPASGVQPLVRGAAGSYRGHALCSGCVRWLQRAGNVCVAAGKQRAAYAADVQPLVR